MCQNPKCGEREALKPLQSGADGLRVGALVRSYVAVHEDGHTVPATSDGKSVTYTADEPGRWHIAEAS